MLFSYLNSLIVCGLHGTDTRAQSTCLLLCESVFVQECASHFYSVLLDHQHACTLCTYAHFPTHTYTRTHTYIHTYTYLHTYTRICAALRSSVRNQWPPWHSHMLVHTHDREGLASQTKHTLWLVSSAPLLCGCYDS